MKQTEIKHYIDYHAVQLPSAKALLILLWRNWKLLLVGFLLGLSLGLYTNSEQIPMYRSTLSMLIQPQTPSMSQVKEGYFFSAKAYRYYETQYRVMKSHEVVSRAVENLGLGQPTDRYEYQLPASMTETIINLLPFKKATVRKKAKTAKVSFNREISAINYIKNGFNLSAVEDSDFIELSFKKPIP